MAGSDAPRPAHPALRWAGVCAASLGLLAGLALLAVRAPDLAYTAALILPLPLLWLLFRQNHEPRFPAPWWAGLAAWAFVIFSRAGGALLALGGVLPISYHVGIAAAGSLFPFVALAILWGERSGGRAYGFTLRGVALQVSLGTALAVALQAAMRAPHIIAGELHADAAALVVLARSLPLEMMTISLGEEALFRAYMQVTLQRRYPWWFATVLISVLFGLWHLPGAVLFHSPIAALAIVGFPFAFGLLAGVMFRLSGSIVGPVVAHALYNAINAMLA